VLHGLDCLSHNAVVVTAVMRRHMCGALKSELNKVLSDRWACVVVNAADKHTHVRGIAECNLSKVLFGQWAWGCCLCTVCRKCLATSEHSAALVC
jgi:hypothetical protein